MNNKLGITILIIIELFLLLQVSCINRSEMTNKKTEAYKNNTKIIQDNNVSNGVKSLKECTDSILNSNIDEMIIDSLDTINFKIRNKCIYIVNADYVFYPFGTMLDYDALQKRFKGYEIIQGEFNGVKTYNVTNQNDTLLFYFVKTYRYSWTCMEIVKASIKSNIMIHDIIHVGMTKSELCAVYSGIQCEILNDVDTCAFCSNVDDVCMNLMFSENILERIEFITDYVMQQSSIH